jgi:type I restriction enzyme, S subunit
MVNAAPRKKAAGEVPSALPKFSTSIRLSEMIDSGLRFEAAAFNIEARQVVQEMKSAGHALVPLYGDTGLATFASKPTRFPRVYVNAAHGTPFLSSSDIINMRPDVENYLSRKLTMHLDQLLVREWDVLISRSGTVGNVGLAPERFTGWALSEHAIRLRAPSPEDAAFITVFLRSRYGRLQLIQASYGSVVQHIEPEHLGKVLVPNLPKETCQWIGGSVLKAYRARNDANKLLDEADSKLHALLKLPPLADVLSETPGPVIVRQRASKLSFRFDASFHDPVAKAAERVLRKSGWDITSLSDPRVTSQIRAITKFRKRVYVPTGGIPMLSSKQLMQIDPVDIKRLSKGAHTKDLPEIALKRDMVTVSCSGTIGRVQIIPPYMEGWTANQHATRLVAGSEVSPGYLYAWLVSDYGQRLLKRYSYGSVILEIDRDMIGSVSIPLPPNGVQKKIGELVLRANELRDQAWRVERDAIQELEELIDTGTKRPVRPV